MKLFPSFRTLTLGWVHVPNPNPFSLHRITPQYLHQPQAGAWGKPVIVHRDVKTENILMDSNLRARLSDVGIARQLDRGGSGASTRLIGTWG